MKYDLSIIVPIYNVEKYLDQAVQSLLMQKEFNYEIVLVNDGSTDGCQAICEKYRDANADRVQVVSKPNGGLPSARKAGVEAARGEYITFLDGDDWIDDDYYYNMMKSANKNDAEVVCSSFRLSYQDREIEYKNAIVTGVYSETNLEEVKKKVLYTRPYYTYGIVPSLCMKVIQKKHLESYLYKVPNDVTLAEDAACTYPLLFSCNKMIVLNENMGYHYRQIKSSMTYAYDSKKVNKVINVMDYLESAFAPYDKKFGEQIDVYYTQLIKDAVKNEFMCEESLKFKKEKLMPLLQKEYVDRALKMVKKIPFQYKIFFRLLKKRKFVLLNVGYTLYKKIEVVR